MNTQTAIVVDHELLRRRPIPQAAWVTAYSLATNQGNQSPELRHPDAQIATCDMNGCHQPVIPTNPPHVRNGVRWFEAVCTGCDRAYAHAQPTDPNPSIDHAALRYGGPA